MTEALASILAAPVRLGRYLITHPKAIVALVILVFALLALRNCAASSKPAAVEVPEYQAIAPKIKDAPYIVQTSSRAYYVAEFDNSNGVLTLTEYYTYDKKKWEKRTIPLPLPVESFGEARLSERVQ